MCIMQDDFNPYTNAILKCYGDTTNVLRVTADVEHFEETIAARMTWSKYHQIQWPFYMFIQILKNRLHTKLLF